MGITHQTHPTYRAAVHGYRTLTEWAACAEEEEEIRRCLAAVRCAHILHEMDYHEYLQTEEWKQFRRWISGDGAKPCQRCGKATDQVFSAGMNIHHLTYHRIGYEHPEDVEVLCRLCHVGEHADKLIHIYDDLPVIEQWSVDSSLHNAF